MEAPAAARKAETELTVTSPEQMRDLGRRLAALVRAGDLVMLVHPSLGEGPPLVHVDAYRLGGGLDEMEDLDLDVSLPESVIVVEWGEGKVEELAEERLQVRIHRAVGDTTDEVRQVTVTGLGERWASADLGALAG
jgi:tRNA threonylcarbamoyladenosine biosynthesis protein TsaE